MAGACGTELCKVRPGPAIGNYLGFSGAGVATCCALPCPALPIHNVTICVLLNCETVLKIQQGCTVPGSGDDDCDAVYSCGQTYDSWGRKCRVVTWQRMVPDDAFIRLRFCGEDACETTCGGDRNQSPVKLLKFEIDGSDVKRIVAAVNKVEYGRYKCIQANCTNQTEQGATGPCCFLGEDNVPTWNLDDIPHGAQIVVGPMNEVPFSYPPLA